MIPKKVIIKDTPKIEIIITKPKTKNHDKNRSNKTKPKTGNKCV